MMNKRQQTHTINKNILLDFNYKFYSNGNSFGLGVCCLWNDIHHSMGVNI